MSVELNVSSTTETSLLRLVSQQESTWRYILWLDSQDLNGHARSNAASNTTPNHRVENSQRPRKEPELYIRWLVTARPFAGHGVGGALIAHACGEARRQGVGLLRVDCYAGSDGRLVDYYRSNGFTEAETFMVGTWRGRVLFRRT